MEKDNVRALENGQNQVTHLQVLMKNDLSVNKNSGRSLAAARGCSGATLSTFTEASVTWAGQRWKQPLSPSKGNVTLSEEWTSTSSGPVCSGIKCHWRRAEKTNIPARPRQLFQQVNTNLEIYKDTPLPNPDTSLEGWRKSTKILCFLTNTSLED